MHSLWAFQSASITFLVCWCPEGGHSGLMGSLARAGPGAALEEDILIHDLQDRVGSLMGSAGVLALLPAESAEATCGVLISCSSGSPRGGGRLDPALARLLAFNAPLPPSAGAQRQAGRTAPGSQGRRLSAAALCTAHVARRPRGEDTCFLGNVVRKRPHM